MPRNPRTILAVIYKVSVIVLLYDYIKRKIKKVTKKCGNFNEVSGLLLLIFQTFGYQILSILLSCFHKFCALRAKHGARRLCAFVFFVGLFFVIFVFVFLGSLWHFTKTQLAPRLQDNIIYVGDYKKQSVVLRFHPETGGKKIPFLQVEIYRYQEEDVQMTCYDFLKSFSNESPTVPSVIWKKNGETLHQSLRYHKEVTLTKLQGHNQPLEKYGLIFHNVTGTLTIYMLESKDFGNYTCHVVTNYSSVETAARYFTKQYYEERLGVDFNIPLEIKGHSEFTKEALRHFKSIRNVTDDTPSNAFRLLEMGAKQITVYAPPKSIFVFENSFWHERESNDDVSHEYLINEQSSLNGICNGLFRGCSFPLLMYWISTYEHFIFPPFVENYWLPAQPDKAKIAKYYQCLCSKAYGYHSVHYVRQFDNSEKGKFEVAEVRYPYEFFVQPMEQDMYNLDRRMCYISSGQYKQNSTCPAPFEHKGESWEILLLLCFLIFCLSVLYVFYKVFVAIVKAGRKLLLNAPQA